VAQYQQYQQQAATAAAVLAVVYTVSLVSLTCSTSLATLDSPKQELRHDDERGVCFSRAGCTLLTISYKNEFKVAVASSSEQSDNIGF
jgi:hypothetical protein